MTEDVQYSGSSALFGMQDPVKGQGTCTYAAGIVTPPERTCGLGNNSQYASLARSFAMKDVQVVTGNADSLYRNSSIDFIVSIENPLAMLPPRLRDHAYVIDYAVLGKKACKGMVYSMDYQGKMIFGEKCDLLKMDGVNIHGVKVIGYYSDSKGLDIAKDEIEQDDDDHSFERDRFSGYGNSMFKLADFTVEQDKRKMLERIAYERSIERDAAILLGGAPPRFISGFVRNSAELLEALHDKGICAKMYCGSVDDEGIKRRILESRSKGCDLAGKMPYEEYMRDVASSEIIITKPGWNTVSDLIYLSQCLGNLGKESPHYIFTSDPDSIPETIAEDVLRRKGFNVCHYGYGSKFLADDIQRIVKDQEEMSYAQRVTQGLCSQVQIKSIVDIVMDSEKKASERNAESTGTFGR